MALRRVVSATLVFAMAASSFTATAADRNPEALQRFLTGKHDSQQATQRALVSRGLQGHFDANLQQVQARLDYLPPALMAATAADRQRLQQSYIIDAAQMMTALGWSTSGADAARANGIDVVNAGARILRGAGSDEDLAALTDTVVVARAIAPGPERRIDDGFASSLRYVVVDVLKGDVRKGDQIVLRQRSGRRTDGTTLSLSTDVTARPGALYLLTSSENGYVQQLAEAGRSAPARHEHRVVLWGSAVELTLDGRQAMSPDGPRSQVDRLRRIAAKTRVQ